MDEEIDDERKTRINRYGVNDSYVIRRLRTEIGSRLETYSEAEAIMETKREGYPPFFREKPQTLALLENENAELKCFAVGDPKPNVQWFKNDMIVTESKRIKIITDADGRSILKFTPAVHFDVGIYKAVARNSAGQTLARCRVVEANVPDTPDSPEASSISDTEILVKWKQPRRDGNSAVICYSLQYKEGSDNTWHTIASNIDHEFYLVHGLKENTKYQFKLAARNHIGWSDMSIPLTIDTQGSGAAKIQITKAMKHLQQITESGQDITVEHEKSNVDYNAELNPPNWITEGNISEKYSFISEISAGRFSTVVKGIHKTTDTVIIGKILELNNDTEAKVNHEYEMMRTLRHERIPALLAAFKPQGSPVAILVQEKLQGADVLTYFSSRHEYNEQMVATVVIQLLDALQYLHWRGYCHLNIQPDNIVMASVRSVQVKLIDFDAIQKVSKLGSKVPLSGILDYQAPEMVNEEPVYPQTDIWSVGVLTYLLLSGCSAFRGNDDIETKQNISCVRYRFENLYPEVTAEATRFIMYIFKRSPQ